MGLGNEAELQDSCSGEARGLGRGVGLTSCGLFPGSPEAWARGHEAVLWRFVPAMPEAWAGAMRVISRGLFLGTPDSWAMAMRPVSRGACSG